MIVFNLWLSLTGALAGSTTESYKDQYCTDPRTMRRHQAHTEWADAYSCTRHRCQPGGRNLAIYTVGCKRVEAPESAIECEEVVEDTNMQFPYCCTRLRCLVVVRGEVWTRVLGQPWETLPAAPWSHMYKMKKPPPADDSFLPKNPSEGPIYELAASGGAGAPDKVLRTSKKTTTDGPECNDVAPRAAPAPDIVIALTTNDDAKEHKKRINTRHIKRSRKTTSGNSYMEEDPQDQNNWEVDDPSATETVQQQQVVWTEIPQNQWNDHESSVDPDSNKDPPAYQPDLQSETEQKESGPTNLQALVDAIGTRMRDIENVVQRMSEKVHQPKTGEADYNSAEKRVQSDLEMKHEKHYKGDSKDHGDEGFGKPKMTNPDEEHYKRLSLRNHASKYLHSAADGATEQPPLVEEANLKGYFSDASNNMFRRSNQPKESAPTYMAPVDNHRRSLAASTEVEKKRKKHTHKRKKSKGRSHKKHRRRDEKRKKFSRINSVELDRNVVSLEDSSAVVTK